MRAALLQEFLPEGRALRADVPAASVIKTPTAGPWQNAIEAATVRKPEMSASRTHPTLTAVGVTWLYGFDFEIKVGAKLPETIAG